MNWQLFAISMGVFLASYVPAFASHMLVRGDVTNEGLRAILYIVDGALDMAAIVLLWYSFPSTWYSLAGCTIFVLLAITATKGAREAGWDPYGTHARGEARRAAAKAEIDALADQMQARHEMDEVRDDLIETAWGIIANANEGDWSKSTPEWHEAAERWRDSYHRYLDQRGRGDA